jgi:serine/threonine protein kinase
MYKYSLNSQYEKYKTFLLNIREYFQQSDNSIHRARNEIKVIDGLVVKSFKNPNFIKKLIYKFIPSKAKRSYEYSLRLKEFAPTPIGYIEFYKNGLLEDSYFVSEEFKYDFTIREPLLDKNFPNKEEIFKEFAHFTFKLHSNGILHKDYSPGNILIKKDKNGYIFKIVDVNRMEFRTLTLNEKLKNFDKLWAKDEDLEQIISEYAKLLNVDKDKAIEIALSYSKSLKRKVNLKKRIKGIEVVD